MCFGSIFFGEMLNWAWPSQNTVFLAFTKPILGLVFTRHCTNRPIRNFVLFNHIYRPNRFWPSPNFLILHFQMPKLGSFVIGSAQIYPYVVLLYLKCIIGTALAQIKGRFGPYPAQIMQVQVHFKG